MKKYFLYILLGLAVLIAIATRFYKLGSVPEGLYLDEAGQGYSAYSILKTGKDEFGKSFPVVFRSFTDFKTPVYTYLIVPLIPVFGLNAFTVRFPSFIFGVLTIPLLYFLIYEISKKRAISLIASYLLAISPWHILFSRTDFETNIALFLFLLGILLLLKSLKKPFLLIISALIFALSITAYQSERIIVPIFLTVYFFKYRKVFFSKKFKPFLFWGLAVGMLVLLPTILIASSPGFWARASGLNIFSHARQLPDGYIANYHGVLSLIINGSWFLSAREFFWQYFSYFSPRYMFVLGDSGPRSSYPDLGTFFLWQFPFYLWGFWTILKNKTYSAIKFFAITLLLIAPIPAAVTRDPYTSIRALPLVIPQIIIISIGIFDIFQRIKGSILRITAVIIFAGLIFYSLFKLYSSIVILNEYYRAKYWDWGWQKVTDVIQNSNRTLPVIVDNARTDPELQIAFFLKYDPAKYQKENFEVPLNEYYTNLYRNRERHIGNFVTRSINWESDLLKEQYLVGDELAISPEQIKNHHLKLISEIDFPDGTVAFRIVQTNPEWESASRLMYNRIK